MTVSELIEELKKYPQDFHVVHYSLYEDGSECIEIPDIGMKNISFDGKDSYGEECLAYHSPTKEIYSPIKALTIEGIGYYRGINDSRREAQK